MAWQASQAWWAGGGLASGAAAPWAGQAPAARPIPPPLPTPWLVVGAKRQLQQRQLQQGNDAASAGSVCRARLASLLSDPQVEAEANTDSRPLPGFTPRSGKGLPFGILGVSSTDPPARANMRAGFQFDWWVQRRALDGTAPR